MSHRTLTESLPSGTVFVPTHVDKDYYYPVDLKEAVVQFAAELFGPQLVRPAHAYVQRLVDQGLVAIEKNSRTPAPEIKTLPNGAYTFKINKISGQFTLDNIARFITNGTLAPSTLVKVLTHDGHDVLDFTPVKDISILRPLVVQTGYKDTRPPAPQFVIVSRKKLQQVPRAQVALQTFFDWAPDDKCSVTADIQKAIEGRGRLCMMKDC